MRKQILLVENSAQLRTPVENTLRQAGYEVVAVDSAERAEGILGVSSFDLTMIGAGVPVSDGTLFVDAWMQDSERAGSPLLILASVDAQTFDWPDEAVVRVPVDAKSMIAQVRVFTGEASAEAASGPDFGDDNAVDDTLDAALGLDEIQVGESETFGGDTTQIPVKKKSENMVGYDAEVTNVSGSEHALTDTKKIDLALAQNKKADEPPQKKDVAEPDKLDLAEHRFTGKPQADAQPGPAPAKPEGDHDYEWFMREMQKDAGSGATTAPAGGKDSASAPGPEPQAPVDHRPDIDPAEVFIEKVREDLSGGGRKSSSVFDWDDDASSDPAVVFAKKMAEEVAERVADKLMSHLNSEKFLKLIRDEIRAYMKQRA